ncbi:MAG: hypothetical protein LIP23_05550, partial [Planctomycetes bacterium]|nr:hypothetical protein [Planctomycetota bacterium]
PQNAKAKQVNLANRNIRAKLNLPPKAPMNIAFSAAESSYAESLSPYAEMIKQQAAVETLEIGVELSKPGQAASEVLPGAQVYAPLAGLMDVEVERKRIEKDLDKKSDAAEKLNLKLHNLDFTSKAPKEVVEREFARRDELARQIKELTELRDSLSS